MTSSVRAAHVDVVDVVDAVDSQEQEFQDTAAGRNNCLRQVDIDGDSRDRNNAAGVNKGSAVDAAAVAADAAKQ